ncbi:MAG: MBL fold metallo-hydrolase [Treponema sp.]|nr:MBL fold metallo-hydrolase [Treponema sp.]
MSLIQITPQISYLPASEKPLSCDIVFIKTEDKTWIFDVGMNDEAAEEINKIPEEQRIIVLSHFHPDHVMNLRRVKSGTIYVSKNTNKYILFKGTVLEEGKTFDGNPQIKILEMPSSHAKGCLCLVCGDYAFLGDGAYCKPVKGMHFYNAQKLQEMIKFLEELDVKYFCLSHDVNFIQDKKAVLMLYRSIYARRQPNNPFINVEDYF